MASPTRKLAIVLGIRPVFITGLRGSCGRLQPEARDQVVFIWSGQHYSATSSMSFSGSSTSHPPDIEFGAVGETDAEVVALVIPKLYPVLAGASPRPPPSSWGTRTRSWGVSRPVS